MKKQTKSLKKARQQFFKHNLLIAITIIGLLATFAGAFYQFTDIGKKEESLSLAAKELKYCRDSTTPYGARSSKSSSDWWETRAFKVTIEKAASQCWVTIADTDKESLDNKIICNFSVSEREGLANQLDKERSNGGWASKNMQHALFTHAQKGSCLTEGWS